MIDRRITDEENRVVVIVGIRSWIHRIAEPAIRRTILVELVLIRTRNATSDMPADAESERFVPYAVCILRHIPERIGIYDAAGIARPVVELTRQIDHRRITRWLVIESDIDAVLREKNERCENEKCNAEWKEFHDAKDW